MPLEKQTIHLPLAQGPHTKEDPRALEPPGLRLLENGVFDEIGGIQKRPPFAAMGLSRYDGGGSVEAARLRALGVREGELMLFAAGRCYAREDVGDKWIDRGRFESVLVDQRTVAASRNDQVLPDRAENGGVVVYAWQDITEPGVVYQLYDKATGAALTSSASSRVEGAVRPRCLAVGDKLHVYWIGDDATGLYVDVITPNGVYTTVGSPITITSAEVTAYDVAPGPSSKCIVAHTRPDAGGPLASVKELDAAGSIGTSRDIARRADYLAVSYNAAATKYSLIRMVNTGAADEIRHDFLLAALGDDVNVNISIKVESVGTVANVGTATTSQPLAYLFWDLRNQTPTYDQVRTASILPTMTSTTARTLVHRCKLGSRPIVWVDGTVERVMVHVFHGSPQQPCYFFLDAQFAVGDAAAQGTSPSVPQAGDEVGLLARLLPQEGPGDGLYVNGHLGQIQALGGNEYAWVGTFRRRLVALGGDVYAERGIRSFIYRFLDSAAFQGVSEGRTLYLPGGYLAQYDGRRVSESGFLLYPEPEGNPDSWGQDSGGVLEGGGGTVDKIYSYKVYWEWRNASGELERSTFAGAKAVNLRTKSGSDNKVVITVPNLPVTNKPDVVLAVYRTKVNSAGPYYRVSPLDPGAAGYKRNSVNVDAITFADDIALRAGGGMPDSALDDQELDPLPDGEWDPVAPPATVIVAAGQNRLFTRDPEDRSLVRFSKLRFPSDAVMGQDTAALQVPQEGGDVVALAVADNGLLALKEHAIYLISGNGPSNTGDGAYTSPQRIAEVGCVEARSVVRAAPGLFFKSARGFYLLDGAYQASYIGAPVEDYNALAVRGAVAVPDEHQVRFVLSSGGTLMYDYLVGEWSYWPGRFGMSAVVWQDLAIHLESTGPMEPSASYSDEAAVPLVLETAWIKPGGLQGCGRVWRLELLGESATATAFPVRVRLAYDYEDTWVDSWAFTVAAPVGEPVRILVGPSRQKCAALRVRVEDASAGAGAKWTGVSLEIGVRQGLSRRPAHQRALRALVIAPTAIAGAADVGVPTVGEPRIVYVVAPSAVASGEAFGTLILSTGAVTLSPSGIASAEAFGTPTLSTNEQILLPSGIASAEACGTPTVTAMPSPVAWFRSDLGITLVGSKVSQWDDQSGNNYHLAQGTDSKRPEKVDGVVDGYPVVRFASGGTPRILSWSGGPGNAQAKSVVMVWKQVGRSGTYQLAVYTNGGFQQYLGYNDNQPTVDDTAVVHWGVESVAGNVYGGIWAHDHSAPQKCYITIGTGTELNGTSGTDSPTCVSLGLDNATFALESDIVELRIYNAKLTVAQWTALYATLRVRYPSLP